MADDIGGLFLELEEENGRLREVCKEAQLLLAVMRPEWVPPAQRNLRAAIRNVRAAQEATAGVKKAEEAGV